VSALVQTPKRLTRMAALLGFMFVALYIVPLPGLSAEVATMQMLQRSYEQAPDSISRTHHGLSLADALRREGKNRAAINVLLEVEPNVQPDQRVSFDLLWATTTAGMGQFLEATTRLYGILAYLSNQADNVNQEARSLTYLQLGAIQVETRDLDTAQGSFEQSARLAKQIGNAVLEARARLNALRAQIENKDLTDIEARFTYIERLLSGDSPQPELQINIAQLRRQAMQDLAMPVEWRRESMATLRDALRHSRSPTSRGWALGLIAALYEDDGQLDAAERYTHQALFMAQEAQAVDQLYRWEWQLGRIVKAKGDLATAEAAYARATELLNGIRSNFVVGSRTTFKRLVEPVYTQYTDVLLHNAAAIPPGDKQQEMLSQARGVLETLKKAEVDDYFAQECLAEEEDAAFSFRYPGAAILYPVILENRLVLLVEINGEFAQFSTQVGRFELIRTIRRLRVNLERPATVDQFMQQATVLYDWLLRPAETHLKDNGVETLVIIPDGALRTIPIAALHDGEQFVLQSFAVATTPALRLTKQLERSRSGEMLIGGVSSSVQGFSALPGVAQEIDTIASMYTATQLHDEGFHIQSVSDNLENAGFSVAHFATHGEFNRDYRKSFLLTYDDKLTLNTLQTLLESRGDQSLDMLVLSACQTAAGDDRAALGLAGVAVQSGAKSALASLWSISDAATTRLVEAFYTELEDPRTTKAESLRRAQLKLLDTDTYDHPSFWAPYLLIGNWL